MFLHELFRRRTAHYLAHFLLLSILPGAYMTAQLPDPTTQHLIICPAGLESEFSRLAEHRSGAGVPSQVMTLESILTMTPAGRDDAETLRDYLVQAHAASPLSYLLLGGDAGVMPTRLARSTLFPGGSFTDISCDLYFGALDGNWDADGDGVFGEAYNSSSDPGDDADLEPELSVGRAPVSSLAQAARFVDGVIDYDTLPQATHLQSALLAADVLFPSDWTGGVIQLDGAIFAEQIQSQLLLHPSAVSSLRLYENDLAYPGSADLDPQSFAEALGSGMHGTFYLIAHGYTQEFSVGTGTVDLAVIDALDNAPYYGIFTALSSNAAHFSEDCILEHLVTAPQGGCAAAIGSSEASFPSMSTNYVRELFVRLTADSGVLLGDAMTVARSTFVANTFRETTERWTTLCWVLLGDPGMPYRVEATPIPAEITSFAELKEHFRP